MNSTLTKLNKILTESNVWVIAENLLFDLHYRQGKISCLRLALELENTIEIFFTGEKITNIERAIAKFSSDLNLWPEDKILKVCDNIFIAKYSLRSTR